jgi:hypothetical protein
MLSNRAVLKPWTKPPSIWALTISGLIALPTSKAATPRSTSTFPGIHINFDLDCLRPGGVMHHRPRSLTGLWVQTGDIGGHEAAAPQHWPAHPALVVGQRDAVDGDILQEMDSSVL